MGSPGIIHDRTPDCQPKFPEHGLLITSTERSFDLQVACHCYAWVIFLLHDIHWCLYNQALADVRSTGAGIKCLYCTCIWVSLVCITQIEDTVKEFSPIISIIIKCYVFSHLIYIYIYMIVCLYDFCNTNYSR